MDDDLKPRIQRMFDTATFELGEARMVTRVTFYVGKYGPFEHDFPIGVSRYDIEQVINKRRDSIPTGA